MSALEHAVPERFFNDPQKCNPQGTTNPTAGLPECPQGISAVKAIALGAQAGQKVYTITPEVYRNNPNIVNANLAAHSQATKARIQQALDAGYEVTIHGAPITQSGWSGAGYTMIDPATGAGAYTIEGGSNGGILLAIIVAVILVWVGWAGFVMGLVAEGILAAVSVGVNSVLQKYLGLGDNAQITVSLIEVWASFVLLTVALLLGSEFFVLAGLWAILGAFGGLLWDIFV